MYRHSLPYLTTEKAVFFHHPCIFLDFRHLRRFWPLRTTNMEAREATRVRAPRRNRRSGAGPPRPSASCAALSQERLPQCIKAVSHAPVGPAFTGLSQLGDQNNPGQALFHVASRSCSRKKEEGRPSKLHNQEERIKKARTSS